LSLCHAPLHLIHPAPAAAVPHRVAPREEPHRELVLVAKAGARLAEPDVRPGSPRPREASQLAHLVAAIPVTNAPDPPVALLLGILEQGPSAGHPRETGDQIPETVGRRAAGHPRETGDQIPEMKGIDQRPDPDHGIPAP